MRRRARPPKTATPGCVGIRAAWSVRSSGRRDSNPAEASRECQPSRAPAMITAPCPVGRLPVSPVILPRPRRRGSHVAADELARDGTRGSKARAGERGRAGRADRSQGAQGRRATDRRFDGPEDPAMNDLSGPAGSDAVSDGSGERVPKTAGLSRPMKRQELETTEHPLVPFIPARRWCACPTDSPCKRTTYRADRLSTRLSAANRCTEARGMIGMVSGSCGASRWR
jgi:hypothetical protein